MSMPQSPMASACMAYVAVVETVDDEEDVVVVDVDVVVLVLDGVAVVVDGVVVVVVVEDVLLEE